MNAVINGGPVLAKTAPPTPDASQARLEAAARDFEALLVNQLMKSMRATLPESDLFGDGGKVRMYQELRDEELSKVVSRDGGLGLAEMLIESLQRGGAQTLEQFDQLKRGPSEAVQSYATEARNVALPGQ